VPLLPCYLFPSHTQSRHHGKPSNLVLAITTRSPPTLPPLQIPFFFHNTRVSSSLWILSSPMMFTPLLLTPSRCDRKHCRLVTPTPFRLTLERGFFHQFRLCEHPPHHIAALFLFFVASSQF